MHALQGKTVSRAKTQPDNSQGKKKKLIISNMQLHSFKRRMSEVIQKRGRKFCSLKSLRKTKGSSSAKHIEIVRESTMALSF